MPKKQAHDKLMAVMRKANLEQKFDPATWPPDEDLVKWIAEYIRSFRKELEDVTMDELLRDPKINLKKFDKYFFNQ